MRSCEKNKRTIFYAKFLSSEPILDEFGNDTLEVNQIYSEPVELKVNYSSNVGEDSTKVFGNLTNYSRTLAIVGSECPLNEHDIVWINKDVSTKANYEVLKVYYYGNVLRGSNGVHFLQQRRRRALCAFQTRVSADLQYGEGQL